MACLYGNDRGGTVKLFLAEDVAERFVDEACGEDVGGMVAGLREQLDDVHADNFLVIGDGADQRCDLVPIEAAGLGRISGGNDGRIEAAEINCEINVRGQIFENLGNPIFEWCAHDIFGPVDSGFESRDGLRLIGRKRANAHLHRGADLNDSAHRARVARGIALIIVAKAGVRADVKDVEILVFLGHGQNQGWREGVFASDSDRKFVVVEQCKFGGEQLGHHFFESAVHRVNRGKGGDADLAVGFHFQLVVVKLHVAAGRENGGRAAPGAVLKRGGALERDWKDHGAGRLVGGVVFGQAAEIVGRHGRVTGHRMPQWRINREVM